MGNDGAQSVDRALSLLLGIVDDQGRRGLAEIGQSIGLAPATSYRLANSLRRAGMLVRSGNGRFLPGFALASRRDMFSANAALIACSRPILKRLAGLTQGVAHIGILEDDMVTYLVREGTEVGTIFSKEDRQLEAYCSALGKMLLGSMPAELQDAYLASAPFVALTDRTITDPEALRAELRRVAAQGFAHDNGEAATGVRCFAVPVRDRQGAAVAALSLSVAGRELDHTTALASLSEARAQLENALYPV